jgi:hypothetical protein
MGAPLYSDSRVSQELGVVTDAMLDYSKSFNVGLDVALRVTRQMRDEYEARIAELEGELAERDEWEPVPDGVYAGITVDENGSELWMAAPDPHGHLWDTDAFLGVDYRLCRRKPKESTE